MESILHFLATFSCGLFAGASVYINAVEHPARMACGPNVALSQWKPSYQRATIMQASLAVLSCLFSLAAWLLGAQPTILAAGVLLLLVVPFTLFVIMPTNNRLMQLGPGENVSETVTLLTRWNRLHLVRSIISVLALAIFIWQA